MAYTGEGDDYMGKKKDGLLFKWRWGGTLEGKIPSQVCRADWKDYELEGVSWHSDFEAKVAYQNGFARDHSFITKGGYKTRLEAQKGAERLLLKHLKEQCKLLKEVTLMKVNL